MADIEIIWDKRDRYVYEQTDPSQFDSLNKRYKEFMSNINNANSTPITVFDPLKPKILQEIELIREVSKDLQKKKEDDINKQKAAEAAETEKEETTEPERAEETETKEAAVENK